MSGGMGSKTARSEAIELHRSYRYTPEHIAKILTESRGREHTADQVREWIYGKARQANRRRTPAISPASPAQRAKIRGRQSVVKGTGPVDPAHLWPRSLGGCDDPLCVVPLARSAHRPFDLGELDLLPALIKHGYIAEIAHAVEHANGALVQVLERLTGQRWAPRDD